jgi:hypothetical protein
LPLTVTIALSARLAKVPLIGLAEVLLITVKTRPVRKMPCVAYTYTFKAKGGQAKTDKVSMPMPIFVSEPPLPPLGACTALNAASVVPPVY